MQSNMSIVKAEATLQLIGVYTLDMAKSKYRKLQKSYHPDVNPGIDQSMCVNANLAFETIKEYFEFNNITEKLSSFVTNEKYHELITKISNYLKRHYYPANLRTREEVQFFNNCYYVIEYYDNIIVNINNSRSISYDELERMFEEIKIEVHNAVNQSIDSFCLSHNIYVGDIDILTASKPIHKVYEALVAKRDQTQFNNSEHVTYIVAIINKINKYNYKNTISDEEQEYFNNAYGVIDQAIKDLNDEMIVPSPNYQEVTQNIYNRFIKEYQSQVEYSISRYLFNHGITEQEMIDYTRINKVDFSKGVHTVYQILSKYVTNKNKITSRLQNILNSYNTYPYFNEIHDKLEEIVKRAIDAASIDPNNTEFIIIRLHSDIKEQLGKYARFVELSNYGEQIMQEVSNRIEYSYYYSQIDQLYEQFKANINNLSFTEYEVKRQFTDALDAIYREYANEKGMIQELQSSYMMLEGKGETNETQKIKDEIKALNTEIGTDGFEEHYEEIKESIRKYKYNSARRIEINKLYKLFMYKLNLMLQNEKDLTAAYPKYNQAVEIVTTILSQFEQGLIHRSFITALSEVTFVNIDELISKITPLIPGEVYINLSDKTEYFEDMPIYVERKSINGNKVYKINSNNTIEQTDVPETVLKTKFITLRQALDKAKYVSKSFGEDTDKLIMIYQTKDIIVYYDETNPDYIGILRNTFRMKRRLTLRRSIYDNPGYQEKENIIGKIIYNALMSVEPRINTDETFGAPKKYTKI